MLLADTKSGMNGTARPARTNGRCGVIRSANFCRDCSCLQEPKTIRPDGTVLSGCSADGTLPDGGSGDCVRTVGQREVIHFNSDSERGSSFFTLSQPTNLPQFTRRLQLPISLGVIFLLTPRRDVANGTVQGDVLGNARCSPVQDVVHLPGTPALAGTALFPSSP